MSDTTQRLDELERQIRVIQARVGIDLSPPTLGTMDEQQLLGWVNDDAATVKEVLAAVGADAVLAQRVLRAERLARGEGARSTLIAELNKVAAGQSEPEPEPAAAK